MSADALNGLRDTSEDDIDGIIKGALDDLNADEELHDARRDQYGRYKVVGPDGKMVGYTRATTIAKALDDTSNLVDWQSRIVLVGVARSRVYYARALTTNPNDKKALNALVADCKELGGGNDRRDLGSAVHKFVELKVQDEAYEVPPMWAADVEAIIGCLAEHGFRIVARMSEVMVVIDRLQISGTADFIVEHIATGRLFIADLKTGSSMDYGTLGFAVQLSIYANGDAIYVQGPAPDGSKDERQAMPDVNPSLGFVLHCEPESGICRLYMLDLEQGTEALALAYRVHQQRKSKVVKSMMSEVTGADLTATIEAALAKVAAKAAELAPAAPIETTATEAELRDEAEAAMVTAADPEATGGMADENPEALPVVDELSDEMAERVRSWFLVRVDAITKADALKVLGPLWPEGVAKPGAVRKGEATWTPAEFEGIEAALDRTEKLEQVPFGPKDPRKAALVASNVDGRIVHASPEDVTALRARLKGLSAADRKTVKAWSEEAISAGQSWQMGRGKVVNSNYARSLLATHLAEWEDKATCLAAIAAGLGQGAYDGPVGVVLSMLTADEAMQVVRFLEAGPSLTFVDDAPVFEAV